MHGEIPSPSPSPTEIRAASEDDLRGRIAEDLGVDVGRLFLTTGASQANALAVTYLGSLLRGGASATCRYCPPEYPPLFDTARAVGFRLTVSAGDAGIAVVSQPRNPEGDLWDRARLLDWASGARWLIVDETFREFAETPSVLGTERPGLWATGSFTKFFACDDIRVGFLVAPPEAAPEFARFHGLVTNQLAPSSVAGAIRALRDRETTRRRVRAILRANVAALRGPFPDVRAPQAPVMFDRPGLGEDGDSLAERALGASVLVCSGSFFGDPSGVRLCLTRRSFPADLAAYLAVREGILPGRDVPRGRKAVTARPARRRPGGIGRAKAGPS
jgi:histidinol-phosphate/aromatic aminotransferase/cobyric acid decarboxylase-like protein